MIIVEMINEKKICANEIAERTTIKDLNATKRSGVAF